MRSQGHWVGSSSLSLQKFCIEMQLFLLKSMAKANLWKLINIKQELLGMLQHISFLSYVKVSQKMPVIQLDPFNQSQRWKHYDNKYFILLHHRSNRTSRWPRSQWCPWGTGTGRRSRFKGWERSYWWRSTWTCWSQGGKWTDWCFWAKRLVTYLYIFFWLLKSISQTFMINYKSQIHTKLCKIDITRKASFWTISTFVKLLRINSIHNFSKYYNV